MKYGILTVAALAILGGVGAYYYRKQDEPKAQPNATEPETESADLNETNEG